LGLNLTRMVSVGPAVARAGATSPPALKLPSSKAMRAAATTHGPENGARRHQPTRRPGKRGLGVCSLPVGLDRESGVCGCIGYLWGGLPAETCRVHPCQSV